MLHELMQQGGPALTWPIAVVSAIATCIIFERLYFWIAVAIRRDAKLRREAATAAPSAELADLVRRDPLAEAIYWLRVQPPRGRLLAKQLSMDATEGSEVLEKCALVSIALGLTGTIIQVALEPWSGRSLYATLIGLVVSLWCYGALMTFSAAGRSVERKLDGGRRP